MKSISKIFLAVLIFFFVMFQDVGAQQYAPTFDYQHVLNTYFDDQSGLISFQDGRIIFAPEGQINAQVAVVDSKNKVVASFPFYKDYKYRAGVYARALVKTPADLTLTKPGIYSIVYLVNKKPVTRLPFKLVQSSAGDDPFNPQKKYRFDGYWRTFAFIVMRTWKGEDFPEVHYWLGGMDLPAGKQRGSQIVTLFRDGKLVAHSKRTVGTIEPGHFKEVRSSLYHIHPAGKEANAIPFLLKDWQVDDIYELRVNRQSDKAALRSYDFKVSNGKIEGHPRSKLGYTPQVDYIAPRVQKMGGTSLELTEAIWIEDRKIK
jgi:hypothetical protein